MSDNKSLTYLMQLEENTKSEFTEVKNKIDSIDLSIGDLSSISSTISDMQGSILSMKNSIDNMYSFVNETNVIVKDILNGKQISEWIDDLAASGKSSATYADSSRMQSLAESTDAVKNTTVSQYIFDWCVTNNKVGTYYSSYFGTVSGVTWSSLTTSSLVCANSSAFKKVVSDNNAFTVAMANDVFRNSIYSSYLITENIIKSSSVAKSVLSERQKEFTLHQNNTGNYYGLLVSYDINFWSSGSKSVKATLADGSSLVYSSAGEESLPKSSTSFYRFIKSLYAYASAGTVTVEGYYIDFA